MNKKNRKNNIIKAIVSAAVAFFLLIFVATLLFPTDNKEQTKTYPEFVAHVEAGEVEKIEYDRASANFYFYLKNDKKTIYKTANPRDDDFKKRMLESGIEVEEVEANKMEDVLVSVFLLIMQYALICCMFMLIFKKIQGGSDLVDCYCTGTKKFSDVAGLDELKESLQTVIDIMKHPKKYDAAGARIPKGILLYGPPGTGKTLLAKAVAGEANVNFLAVSGSDFDNKYVGVGADKVRKLFEKAKQQTPCILFIDELDALGCKRSGEEHSYERQTLNQLLSSMDGFSSSDGIFIFAATNDPDALDPALLRPGRFDARYAVNLPETTEDRAAVIMMYLSNKKVDSEVSVKAMAKQMIGYSPAMIEAVINDAAIESVKNRGIITQENIDNAIYRQLLGGHQKKKGSYDQNKYNTRTVAWHEAGHALVGYLQNQEISKISIIPSTSGVGGITMVNQEKMGMFSKEELENRVKMLYAGRNAELILNGSEKVTTGASNDISEATKIIKAMVSNYGMSNHGLIDLSQMDISAQDILAECQEISKTLANESMRMLVDHRDALENLADELIEHETLNEKELCEILKAKLNK